MMLELDQIYCGDCIQLLQEIPNNTVDLVVTSPPYDNLRKYNGFTFDFEGVAHQLFRVVKCGGVVVWVVGDATINGSETGTSFRQALYFKSIGFNLHDTMIFAKDSCLFPETNRYYPYFEYMFVLSKGKPKTYNLIRDKPNSRFGDFITGTQREKDGSLSQKSAIINKTHRKVNEFGVRGNVWKYNVGKWKVTKDAIAYKHPAIFPEKLAEDHIISWSNEGDLVLDPLCGSGTVPKMSKFLNRRYIGIDVSEEYCEIARNRLNDKT